MKKDVVIGVIRNYNYSKLEPFIRTLKNTGFDGDVVFFYSEISKRTLKKLEDVGIILIKLDIQCHEHTVVASNLDETGYKKLPLMSYRFIAYLDFLEKNKGKYNNVFLTDTRDVVFQKNPFDFDIGKNVCFFMMGNDSFIAHEKIATRFISAYGKKMHKKVLGKDVSCAGTIIGGINEIIIYLRLMKHDIYKTDDQSIHNALLYGNAIKNKKMFKNGNVVFTASFEEDLKKYINIKNNVILDKKGKIVNIIHGYNRYDVLIDLFEGSSRSKLLNYLKHVPWIYKIGTRIRYKLAHSRLLGKFFRRIYAKLT